MKAKLLKPVLAGLALSMFTCPALAHKLDFLAGGFSLSAKTSKGSGSRSGLGAYKFTYMIPVTANLDFGLGYTLILSDTFTGDAAFGLDLETNYFPFTPNAPIEISGANLSARMSEIWSPFVGAGYHQRQFQSVQTQYNGFSVAAGVERSFNEDFRIKGICRYLLMNGANRSTASVLDVLIGVSVQF